MSLQPMGRDRRHFFAVALVLSTVSTVVSSTSQPAQAIPQSVAHPSTLIAQDLGDLLGIDVSPSLPEYLLYQSISCETYLYGLMAGEALSLNTLGTDVMSGLLLTCGEEVDDFLPGPDLTDQVVDKPTVGVPGVGQVPVAPSIRKPRLPNPF